MSNNEKTIVTAAGMGNICLVLLCWWKEEKEVDVKSLVQRAERLVRQLKKKVEPCCDTDAHKCQTDDWMSLWFSNYLTLMKL